MTTCLTRLVLALVIPPALLLIIFAATSGAAGRQKQTSGGQSVTVVSAGPTGELNALAQGNEIRVVFSEPMVALGRIPDPVTAPFFRIAPAVAGTFRWSGTTVLIFTPGRPNALPYATTFRVTIDASATAVSGRRMAAPYSFTFTTPTVRLLSTHWYRRNGRYDGAPLVLLRFNQPVRGVDIFAHTTFRFEKHGWRMPTLSPAAQARLTATEPQGLAAFNAKVAATAAAAAAETPIKTHLTLDWDRVHYPPSPDLVVFEIVTPVPPESAVRLTVDTAVPSPAGPEHPPRLQTHSVHVEPALFVDGAQCRAECDPDLTNEITFRGRTTTQSFAKVVSVVDVTDAARERRMAPSSDASKTNNRLDLDSRFSLEDLGYDPQPPARTFAIRIDPAMTAADGQRLGYTFVDIVENWHQRSFTSFGGGHGVWETSSGPVLPFYARNLLDVRAWTVKVAASDLMPSILSLRSQQFTAAPSGEGRPRRLQLKPDAIGSPGLDLAPVLSQAKTGLIWAAVQEGTPIPRAKPAIERALQPGESTRRPVIRASLVQVTNLGITVKDSPQNTLILVTRLDNARPVEAAAVSIVDTTNRTVWRGTTDKEGLALAPAMPLRHSFDEPFEFAFIVTAEKDSDAAYVASDWVENTSPYRFGHAFNLHESTPQLRGTVFTDRGVYKPGEEVHLKAIVRHDTTAGMRLLDANRAVKMIVRDTNSKIVDRRIVRVNAWSSGEWTLRVPDDAALGTYSIAGAEISEEQAAAEKGVVVKAAAGRELPGSRGELGRPEPSDDDFGGMAWSDRGTYVRGTFLVAAYRRPEFRVDANLTAEDPIAGATLNGSIDARYLFGAPMVARPVRWTYTRMPMYGPPAALTERFTDARFTFVGCCHGFSGREDLGAEQATLTNKGQFAHELHTKDDETGLPYRYTFEGEVEDLSRQRIAGRASLLVHPAPWYVGVRHPTDFVDAAKGLDTEVVAVAPDGRVVPGVRVELALASQQWFSARRAEGHGFFRWDSERQSVDAGAVTVTTGPKPVPVHIPVPSGGYFILRAAGQADGGRHAVTQISFFALGRGYTAWERFDDNHINLVPERATYKPGETARIMIQSPWEQATALVTTERESVRTHHRFALTSTQQAISVPLTEADIPNVYVSVLLVKGRSNVPGEKSGRSGRAAGKEAAAGEPVVSERWRDDRNDDQAVVNDDGDPGKPAYRLGYTELKVEDSTKKLTLAVRANQLEYRPATNATIDVDVKDRRGQPVASEVTLWAVDHGVLSLTGFKTPELLSSIYVDKALQVVTTDNREKLISRRVTVPKGGEDGGGGGEDSGPGMLRKDFRVLAFWLGSVITDAKGHASTTVKVPESLTTYRIMAVAGDKASRFGAAESDIRINKPVLLRAAFPRFLAVGDSAFFGSVITSQLKQAGTAVVTIRSLDPAVLELHGETRRSLEVGAGGSAEVRFEAVGKAIGRARVQMSVRLGDEGDAFEDVVPVEVLVSPETVAAYGTARPDARETITMPSGVVAGFGGLHLDLASTAMVGLAEGARYLIEYPYGCAEQRSSRTLALLLAADLGEAFTIPDIKPAELKKTVQASVTDLARFQCPSGLFAFWAGSCDMTSPYLTSYVLHVLQRARAMGYQVAPEVMDRGYNALQQEVSKEPPANEGWSPWFTAWETFAVKVLVEGGRNQDSTFNRLYGHRDTMPVFALAYMADVLAQRGETGAPESGGQMAELHRRMANAILPEAGLSHVEELTDPHLMWFWNSNVRSTAAVLANLVRTGGTETLITPMVRWLLAARKHGRWENTHDNAWAMEALVAYYRKFESEPPRFTGTVSLGSQELARERFEGRSTESRSRDLPMTSLATSMPAGTSEDLTFRRDGTGTLFYHARLRYAVDSLFQQGLDSGFAVSRKYSLVDENGKIARDATSFQAGDLVRVTLGFDLTKERRFVAVVDPLPAGLEPIESWFQTTAANAAEQQDRSTDNSTWFEWWQRGGFDHAERHDDRVVYFATRLSEGHHETSYIARATTAGTFRTAPAHAEEMYEPEVFGRTETAVIHVAR